MKKTKIIVLALALVGCVQHRLTVDNKNENSTAILTSTGTDFTTFTHTDTTTSTSTITSTNTNTNPSGLWDATVQKIQDAGIQPAASTVLTGSISETNFYNILFNGAIQNGSLFPQSCTLSPTTATNSGTSTTVTFVLTFPSQPTATALLGEPSALTAGTISTNGNTTTVQVTLDASLHGSAPVVILYEAGTTVGSCSSAVNAYINAVFADQPVGYWPLNESTGTVATNYGSAGTAWNGTYKGYPLNLSNPNLLHQTGPFPGSFSEKGFVVVNLNSTPHPTAGSVEYFTSYQSYSAGYSNPFSVECPGGANCGFRAELDGGSTASMYFVINNVPLNVFGGLSTNKWLHFVHSWNGNTVTTYVNGVQKSVDSGNFNSTMGVLAMGGWYSTVPARYWDGYMSEFAFYNQALSATQVSKHFQASGVAP